MGLSVVGWGIPTDAAAEAGVKIKFFSDPVLNGGTQSVRFIEPTGQDAIVNINICNQDTADRWVSVTMDPTGDAVRVLNDLLIPGETSYQWNTVFIPSGETIDFYFSNAPDTL